MSDVHEKENDLPKVGEVWKHYGGGLYKSYMSLIGPEIVTHSQSKNSALFIKRY